MISSSGLPIKIDPTSNGEFRPVPLTETVARANALAAKRLTEHAARVGLARRAFLQSLCGAATTLLTLNQAFAARGNTGGAFRLPAEAAFEPAAAGSALAGDEFIFDVQTHMVDPAGRWRTNAGQYWEQILARFPQGSCGDDDPVDCFSAEQFIKHVFLDSDTDLAVLSFVPELPESNPLSLEEALRVRVLVEQMAGAHRLFLHAMVVPNAPAIRPLELMAEAVRRYPIAAWKCYTQWGPDGIGFELDDPAVGIPFIEQAQRTRRAHHLHPQGPVVLGLSRPVRSLRRRRPHRQALSGHELHRLPFGLRAGPGGRAVRSRPRRAAASTS